MGIDDESSHPELCSAVADGVTRNIVSLFREPDAGNPHVRFDEREQETELCQTGLRRALRKQPNSHREAKATAPVLVSTRHNAHWRVLSVIALIGTIASSITAPSRVFSR
jgi:hypothetical protein